MRWYVYIVAFFIVSALVIPMMVYGIIFVKNGENGIEKQKNTKKDTIEVLVSETGKVVTLETEEYLCGVVAAEMPASFEKEALKAQAVAARSYAVNRKNNPVSEHPEADVCTDCSHCKAYKTPEELAKMWGEDKEKYLTKIRDAVFSTTGEVVKYNGEVALAVFHSQSGNGRTESSKDVWGGEVPYLVSVESPGEENSPNFYSTVTVSFEEFKEKISVSYPNVVIKSVQDIGETEESDGGSVKYINIAGTKISGKDIRQIFGLRSACFEVETDGNTVIFNVMGYGHGVGMSQYGANIMAQEGADYKQILTHYYTGTEVSAV